MPTTHKQFFTLPDVVHPSDSVCFTIRIPNERHYIGAFYGVIYQLAQWYSWQLDDAHTRDAVAAVWLDIFDALIKGECNVSPPDNLGGECGDCMGCCIRFNNGFLETLNCGVWERVPGQGGGGQPGGGSPQPPAGGGKECYSGQMAANSKWLVPAVVNSGDTLEITSATGAGQDGGVSPWKCPNGQTFFAGACVGAGGPGGSDPAPTVDHMRLIYLIAGIYYDAMAGPVTIPGGVVNAQVIVQVNDDNISDNSGSYQFNLCVTNNQSTGWEHTWDLRLDPGPFHVESGFGVWTAGVGWQGTDGGSGDSLLEIRQNDSAAIELFETTVNVSALGTINTVNAIKHNNPAVTIVAPALAAGINFLSTGAIGVSDSIFVDIYNDPGDTTSFVLTTIHAKGPGAFPY